MIICETVLAVFKNSRIWNAPTEGTQALIYIQALTDTGPDRYRPGWIQAWVDTGPDRYSPGQIQPGTDTAPERYRPGRYRP